MEWIVEKDELLAVLDVLYLVPMRPGQPSSEFFEVAPSKKGGLWFRLAADINGVSHLRGSGEWPFKKAFYLDRKVFVPFVTVAKNLKTSQPFLFKKVGTRLLVKQGKRKASFDNRPEVPGYWLTPKGEKHSEFKLQKTLRELIYCARECATDETQPHLNCVYIKPNKKSVSVMASNLKIIYSATTEIESQNQTPIPFPLFLVSSLVDNEQLKGIEWVDEFVVLTFTHGKIWQPVNAIAAKEFPHKEIAEHIGTAENHPILFQCPITRFTKPVNRLCEYLGAVRREWTLEIQGTKGSDVLQLTVAVSQVTFKEQVKLLKPSKSSFEVTWPLEMLAPVFSYLQKKGKGTLTIRRKEKGVSYVSAPNITVAVPGKKS